MKITKVVPVSLSETEFVVYDDGAGLPEWVVGKFGTEHSYGELAPNWDTPRSVKERPT